MDVRPPLFIGEDYAYDFFESVEAALRYVEPWFPHAVPDYLNRSLRQIQPGSQRAYEHGGLESYDCRNTANPLLVPAFGAAPACKTQGPWTFNGVSAYFPRLQAAPPATKAR